MDRMLGSKQKYRTEDEIAEMMTFRWMCEVKTREDIGNKKGI